MSQGTDRIRMLNDQFRKNLTGGQAFMTPGIAALGREAVQRLIQVLITFDAFCLVNDSHGEHDFGVFDDPDSFYAKHGANLSGAKKWLFQAVVRRWMNANVERVRSGGARALGVRPRPTRAPSAG